VSVPAKVKRFDMSNSADGEWCAHSGPAVIVKAADACLNLIT
jgi:hypothetical protein